MIFSTDVLIIIGLIVTSTAFTFFSGKSRAATLIFALFGSVLLFQTFPFTEKLTLATGKLPHALNIVAIFLVFTTLLYFLFSRYVVGDFVDNKFIKSVIVGFALSAILMSILYFVLPRDLVYNFRPQIDQLFSGNIGLFWWLVIPLGIIFFV